VGAARRALNAKLDFLPWQLHATCATQARFRAKEAAHVCNVLLESAATTKEAIVKSALEELTLVREAPRAIFVTLELTARQDRQR
jgi:hypothetical protein